MVHSNFELSKVQEGTRLPLVFYTRTDVVQIARDLLGKVLVTEFDGLRTSGLITETEAYCAPDDRASHAYGNRRTARTDIMFQEGGKAYIYLCYGIHHLFNVVTGPEETAHAVLVRAIEPIEGLDIMLRRRNWEKHESDQRYKRISPNLTTGPGALSQALGLTTKWTGQSFFASNTPVWIEDRGAKILGNDVMAGKRIGVEYALECADWPWRFWLKKTPFVKKGNQPL